MQQTLVEKIAQKFASGLSPNQVVRSGSYIMIKPAYVMTHDNTGAVIPKFKSIGAKKLAHKRQVVIALDHNVQDKSEKNIQKYTTIENFAREMEADFYPAGQGIGHQIMCEEGYAWPGTLAVASDSHSNMYGGLGCLGTPVVRTDAASIWATGKTWWQVPQVVKVSFTGRLRPGVSGKDVILSLCSHFNSDEVLNHAVEFSGPGVTSLTIDDRLAIANMTTEWGALAGIFPIDEVTIEWLQKRNLSIKKRGLLNVHSDIDGKGNHPRINDIRIKQLTEEIPVADPDAHYAKEIILDLSTVQPFVAGPDSVKKASPVTLLKQQNIRIDKAYLVSCVNSRISDLHEAAKVLRGKKVADHVKLYVSAASAEVQKNCEINGDWQALISAGAVPLPPGCGPCIGLGTGLLEDGETGISATNRNFKGRMGSRNASAYLASPAVVASSAIQGHIDYFWEYSPAVLSANLTVNTARASADGSTSIIKGFPESLTGELIFCVQDNINTDGIYPGKYTYIDDFTPEQQAQVVMENYDPEFVKLADKGSILAGGFNFGTGSSREQAATALKYKGIQLVIAGSFNETYKRNALNNGYLLIECPQLIVKLKEDYGKDKLTVKTGETVTINFVKSSVMYRKSEFSFDPVGEAAQELIILGGLEEWVKDNM